jgi:hypothetical protein
MVNKNLKNPFVTSRLVLITYCRIQMFTIRKNIRRTPRSQIVADANEHVHRVADNLMLRATACVMVDGAYLDTVIDE